ncbi:uncharacterized protein CTRU02_204051 [Colletotrichum truncatum]|uniref:Uncharacterized protein n=1 Tax=Colletotrichum truncatum TaxID=5467 RepID=A0ACC3ZAZ7_COLTU|nr:uncharacterized protein CTRU02_13646 [Colletotrichum truncatum]KAF6783179.1 hypothetical protein CTRU02_13646 [Colletotrichum truncatum]
MAIKVTTLTEADIPGAVKAVQQAFAGDPYNVWVYDQSKFNPDRNYQSLALRMRWGMRNGIFHVAKEEGSDDVLGVAMWLRPQQAGTPSTWNDWLEGWRLWFGQVNYNLWYGRGGLNVKRYYIWKDAQAKAQQELWTDPKGYYFLNIMVVLPQAQGKGVGAKMMKVVTDQADAENMRCYLESSRDVPNMAIYGRWGFKFQKEMICDDDGDAIKLFTMIREPHAEPGDGSRYQERGTPNLEMGASDTKCDERKPSCARCEERGLQCPGYALNVRWSQKHQVRNASATAKEGSKKSPKQLENAPTKSSSEIEIPTLLQQEDEGSRRLDQCLGFTPNWNIDISPDLCSLDSVSGTDISFQQPTPVVGTPWDTSFMSAAWTVDENDTTSPSSAEESYTYQRPSTLGTLCAANIDEVCSQQGLLQSMAHIFQSEVEAGTLVQSNHEVTIQITKEPSNVTTSLSEYFFREVITLYCSWDSKSNVMRNIIETTWQYSGALYHTILSMSAACLSEDFPHLLPVARREHAQALEIINKSSPIGPYKQALLLASQLLGHTSSWLNPQNLATNMFRASYDILEDLVVETGHDACVSFFSDTMDYWAMLLAFLTDKQQLGGYGQNILMGPASSTKSEEPHPYSGISRSTVRILADIGLLIFQYRQRMSTVKFLTENDIDLFRIALREARRLERVLLTHRSPDLSQIKDPGDPKTPLKHLELIDEAYRCTGLLQLYRVFPDLLNDRYAPWNKENLLRPLPSEKVPTAQERQTWLTKLAMHILGILREIPFESRTRSAQPFIMVACSSELKRDSLHVNTSGPGCGDAEVMAIDPASIEVVRARKFILSRLAAYTHILPLRKSRVISELIEQIWLALDGGDQDVYWLDIARKKDLGTMMG